MNLLKLLALYLTLGVDPDPNEPDPNPDPAPDPDPDELPDLGADDPDPNPDPDPDDPAAARADAAAARAEAEAAKREAAEYRAKFETQERSRAAPVANPEQALYEQEEARLRATDITATEKWQIESNRVLRANQRLANSAMFEAREMADKSEFDRLQASNPIAKKYAKRTEEKLAELRSKGIFPERKFVLKMLIGDDIMEGKVKTTKKPSADVTTGVKVNRGVPATQRSDVRGRGAANSESAKRRARLEGQII